MLIFVDILIEKLLMIILLVSFLVSFLISLFNVWGDCKFLISIKNLLLFWWLMSVFCGSICLICCVILYNSWLLIVWLNELFIGLNLFKLMNNKVVNLLCFLVWLMLLLIFVYIKVWFGSLVKEL